MQLTNRARRSLPWTPPTRQTSSTTSFSPCRTAHASTCTAVRYSSSQTVSARRRRHSTTPCTGMCSGSGRLHRAQSRAASSPRPPRARRAPRSDDGHGRVLDPARDERAHAPLTLAAPAPLLALRRVPRVGGARAAGRRPGAPERRAQRLCVGMPRVHTRTRPGLVAAPPGRVEQKILLYAFHRPRPRSIGRDRIPSAASLPWR